MIKKNPPTRQSRHLISVLLIALFAISNSSAQNQFNESTNSLFLSGVKVSDQQIFQAGLNRIDEDQESFHFSLNELQAITADSNISAHYDPGSATVSMPVVDIINAAGQTSSLQVEMQYIPASQPLRFLVLNAHTLSGHSVYDKGINPEQALLQIHDQQTFNKMSDRIDIAGINNIQEIKFVILDIDTDHPVAYLQNSKNYPLHAGFALDVLGLYPDLNISRATAAFNASSYFSEQRHHIAASIIYHEHYIDPENSANKGLFSIQFWPTDPVSFELIEKTYRIIAAALPLSKHKLAYHPSSNSQIALYQDKQDRFEEANIRVVFSDDLFSGSSSSVLNSGEAYGRLRVINPEDSLPGPQDIVIYTFIPNSISHVAGIITDSPQTPLSHINLKARQNNTPNAYIQHASTAAEIAPLINQWVHYQVNDTGYTLSPASQQEAEQWLANIRPAETQIPESDLSVTLPRNLTDIAFQDWTAFGVKAANVAELDRILPPGIAPQGYAVPFALYDEYMSLPRCGDELRLLCTAEQTAGASFYQQARDMLDSEAFQSNAEARALALKALRKNIEKGDAPEQMIATLEHIRTFWEPQGPPFTQSLRTRSSTNNEDLPGFNGAGLYESFTHKDDEGQLIKSIKQVWASLWTDRAYDERDFYRIDHFKTYMGVLIHPNYGDEQVNGVAVSKNIYNPDWEGSYINAQFGEISITNPEPIPTSAGLVSAIPDEFIITHLPASNNDLAWETQFIRHSNVESVYGIAVTDDNVLTEHEIVQLRESLQTIQNHFKNLYQGDDDFAMEIEFKITETDDGSRGSLAIKQARPWID